MTNKKFATGAFVFTRTRAYVPRNPEDVLPLAIKHGFSPEVVPPYAGDRAAIGRAITKTDTKIAGDTYLLRPIRRTGSEVIYGIVRENKTGDDHLDHNHEATVSWKAEPDPAVIEGDHTIANRVRLNYCDLRGKLVSDDWTMTCTKELERLGAVPFREDGRVYWCPPQSLDSVRRLQRFLAEVGVIVVVAEVEAENTGVVTEIVSESVADQLHALALEVEAFDGTQKPGTYARRLEEYQHLRERAILYRDALGVGVERTVEVLNELERKVSEMLELRTKTVVHRDRSVSSASSKTPSETPALNVLTFAGARFTKADSDTDSELLFVSSDERAVSSVRALESMGLAGTWQNAGSPTP
ncbi:MAG: hypothetical protein PHU25_22195 [Deltaproteobacteria bacterium]|nr:hypothetical protein [Deltaproteobacteria bacterium]